MILFEGDACALQESIRRMLTSSNNQVSDAYILQSLIGDAYKLQKPIKRCIDLSRAYQEMLTPCKSL